MISFDRVSKVYDDGTVAVDDVSLTLADGELLVLVGPSGCGKTTLMQMVNRMVSPTSGTVTLDGRNVEDIPLTTLRRCIGYVMQQGGLFPHQSVARNIITVPRLNGVPARTALADVPRLMRTVGLDPDLQDRYPDQLSGGQRQRVSIARALADSPSVLLMDEPFGAIDPVVRRSVQTELLRIHESMDTTIILVTHDISEALRLGDRIAVLGPRSRIAQLGTPDEILAAPASDYVTEFVGGSQSAQLSTRRVGGREVVVDASGRTVGLLRP